MAHDWIQSQDLDGRSSGTDSLVCVQYWIQDRETTAMTTGLPGLRRLDHIGFTVPDLDRGPPLPRRRARLRVPLLPRPVPPRRRRLDGASTSTCHPRAVMRRTRFFRCGGQAVFEVFDYAAPDQRSTPPRNSDVGGHHVALYVDDLDAAVAHLRAAVSPVLGEPTASTGPARASAGSTSSPVGHAVRAGLLPGRQGVRPREPREDTRRARRPPTDSQRVADLPARADPVRRHRARRADPPGGDRGALRRRAGCRCARRCGCSRPRG